MLTQQEANKNLLTELQLLQQSFEQKDDGQSSHELMRALAQTREVADQVPQLRSDVERLRTAEVLHTKMDKESKDTIDTLKKRLSDAESNLKTESEQVSVLRKKLSDFRLLQTLKTMLFAI